MSSYLHKDDALSRKLRDRNSSEWSPKPIESGGPFKKKNRKLGTKGVI